MALIKSKVGNTTYSWKSDDIRDGEIGNLQSLSTTAKNSLVAAINEVKGEIDTAIGVDSVITGDINEILMMNNYISLIIVLSQSGGHTMVNWIGNVDGFIVKLGNIAIAFSGWDYSIRPFYKLNWGGTAANWSQWYQF